MSRLIPFILATLTALPLAHATDTAAADAAIRPCQIRGEQFVDPAGHEVRFWGVNLVAVYPDHAKANALAKELAQLQVNLVRPHHILRPSKDWNPAMASGALLTYQGDSRHFEPDALDRFDYLCAALRRQGIYLSISLNWTRRYLPGDVDILQTSPTDRDEWSAAMKELNGWNWQKAFDVYKMLPTVDERTARLNEEFAKQFLSHVNPYTGIAYGKDPQVLTIEVMNEASTEYAIVCGNKFPDYWQKQLIAKWEAFAAKAGVPAGDLYKPVGPARQLRAQFLRGLDEAYFQRIKTAVRDAGCTAPMMFSNLWRGENELEMSSRVADVVESHAYQSPFVVGGADDFVASLGKSALANKPFFVGELNGSENTKAAQKEAPYRSMMPLAAATYGSLQNWSGIEWFAWMHGDKALGSDGRAASDQRKPNIGQMIEDGMMVDHLRTAGILFRRGLVLPSAQPITIHVDEPFTAADYGGLMRGKYNPKPGWQDIHAIRKSFGAAPAGQASADWMTRQPDSPLVSDTGEITKDTTRQQLTVTAAKAEAFSGKLDGTAPHGLKTIEISGDGFATVVLVSDDDQPLGASRHLIISRTATDASGAETAGPTTVLHGLQAPPAGGHWNALITRTMKGNAATTPTALNASGEQAGKIDLPLPGGSWTECELRAEP